MFSILQYKITFAKTPVWSFLSYFFHAVSYCDHLQHCANEVFVTSLLLLFLLPPLLGS